MSLKNQSHHIFLPSINIGFVIFSLLVSFMLNLLPWGQGASVPDFVALMLIFWSIHEPRKIRISIAFLIGTFIDVNTGAVLGEHALVYTLLSYFSITIHQRVLWFSSTIFQALHILLILLFTQTIQFVVQFVINHQFPHWFYFSKSFMCAILWPVITWFLLVPQRCPNYFDENYPI